MRLPQLYRMREWQRFLAGIVLGCLTGFVFFLSIYGLAQEKQIEKIERQEAEINAYKQHIGALTEGMDEENKKLEDTLTIQDLAVEISSSPKFKLDRLQEFELRTAIKTRLKSLLMKDLESVKNNQPLIIKTVEGEPFLIDDRKLSVKINALVIYTTLELKVKVTDVSHSS